MHSKINIDSGFIFNTELTVRVSDVNYGGHLGNDSVLTLMQEARLMFYRSLGFRDETSFEGTIGQIIVEAHVEYKSESFLGDVLLFSLGVTNITKYGFDMFYHITQKASGKEVARASTTILCFDYTKRKVASIPTVLLSHLNTTKA